jgi:hypothetical protein
MPNLLWSLVQNSSQKSSSEHLTKQSQFFWRQTGRAEGCVAVPARGNWHTILHGSTISSSNDEMELVAPVGSLEKTPGHACVVVESDS